MKKTLVILAMILILTCTVQPVVFASRIVNKTIGNPTVGIGSRPVVFTPNRIGKTTEKAFGTFIELAKYAAFAILIFAGVRYMFASADARADIKKQTAILFIGAAIVFAAQPFIELIVNVVEDIL